MTDNKYAEARRAHAERLAQMRANGGKLIRDYIDPSEPPMYPPQRGRGVRRSRFMAGGDGLPSARVGEQHTSLLPLTENQIAEMESILDNNKD